MPIIDHETFKKVAFKRRIDRVTAKQVLIKKKDMYEPMVR
jgi:hypothetical protein